MAIHMPTGGLLAAALALTAVLSLAADKPGDRPAKQPMAGQAQETLTGSFLTGVGVNSDAGRPGSILLNEQNFETIDTVCPCFFGVLQRWWQTLSGPGPTKTDPEPEAEWLTCPYLKQKAASNPPGGNSLAEKEVSFLDNLEKLDKARTLYERAEFYRRTGHPEAARYYYQLVIDQGPGSRYDQMARQQLNDGLTPSDTAAIFTAPEEQEVLPDPPAEEEGSRGRLQRDQTLQQMEREWGRVEGGTPPPPPVPPERLHGIIMDRLLQPSLPPLDPALAKTLEKILAESGDPEMPKLILQIDSSDDGAEAQELDPALGWIPGSSEEEASILEVFSEDPRRPPDDQEADDEAEDEVIPEFVPDWNQVMREVIEAVGGGACVEIDASRLGRLRFLCQQQVGALTVRIYSDGDGVWRCVVASLDPEASTDLRAAQRAFNDGISRWIEAVGAASGEGTWDEDDDWPDDDGDLDDEYGVQVMALAL